MADVVLDEWVLIRALDAEHPADGLERENADLLAVVQMSHRWVLTDDVIDIYERRIYHARYKGETWTRLRASFIGTLVRADGLWLRGVAEVACEGVYDCDDIAWVTAAAAAPAGCVLVTGDRRLLAQLGRSGLPDLHAFTPCFITDALELLAPEQPALP